MGCNVSRLDSHGATFPARLRPLLLQRFEEIKARRHAGRALKDPTPSKKELLDKDTEEESNASQLLLAPNPSEMIRAYSIEDCIKKTESSPERKDAIWELKDEAPNNKEIIGVVKTTGNNDYDVIKENVKDGDSVKNETMGSPTEDDHVNTAKIEDCLTDADEDEENDDDDDENERMIGHKDDESFPGSPSFRVYFKDNDEVDSHIDIGKFDAFKKTASSDDGVPSNESSVEKKAKKGKKRRSFRKVFPKNLLRVKSCYIPSHSSHDNTHLLTGKTTT